MTWRRPLRVLAVCVAVAAGAGVWLGAPVAHAGGFALAGEQAQEPDAGTVFIRLIGNVQVRRGDDPRLRREVLANLSDVPVATGSGFVISPDGWIVTNRHVVTGESRVVEIDGEKVEITVDVARIEVVFPGNGRDREPRHYEAAITASDEDLDLAILYVSGHDLPYVPLGDSDAAVAGDAVRALGFPFGEALEIGKPEGARRVPGLSVSPGAIASFRRDVSGNVRYVQITAPLNPGNSGGPIVDADGFVVAVAQLEVRNEDGRGIGFGIPVNVLKAFLRRYGVDQRLPSRLLGLGATLDAAERKGLRLLVPDGLADYSPARLQIDSQTSDPELVLRIDRIASDWTPDQIEQALLGGSALDAIRGVGTPRRAPRTIDGRRIIQGWTPIATVEGTARSVIYAIIEAGPERLIARYIGPSELLALNRSVLQSSLASLESRLLLVEPFTRPSRLTIGRGEVVPGSPPVPLPVDRWAYEPGGPTLCAGAGPARVAVTTTPVDDFTVELRGAWHPGPGATADAAARACAPAGMRVGAAGSYSAGATRWGVPYRVEGLFLSAEGGVWQLEMVAPAAKRVAARAAFDEWVAAIRPR